MTLATLKTILQDVTGTLIGSVYFDWQAYLNEVRGKTYPAILWSLGVSEFTQDKRTSTVQKTKELTITVFAIQNFNISTDDKITVWDALEAKFDTYINAMNNGTQIQIMNINELKGKYIPEGMISADSEIGIMFEGVKIKMFC